MRLARPLGVAQENDPAVAGGDLLHVGHGLFEHAIIGRDDDHRHRFVDQRNRAVLELARGIAFGVNVGNFLELERTFERNRIAGAASEIEDVAALCEIARQMLDLGLERERLRHQARHLDQGAHQRPLVRPDSTSRARAAAIPSAASTASWQVKALVEATPISGPASVGMTASLSRAIVEVGTLTTATTCCCCSLA